MANEYLQPFPPGTGLTDYSHAAKVFGTGGGANQGGGSYQYLPRNKFLFHVYFNLNTNIPAVSNLISAGQSSVISLMVKTAQLPSYTIDVGTMNQYNRKRLVQTKINYNPAQIVFNDDNSDLIRNMWYQYYQYYYSDPTYKYDGIPNQNGVLGQIQVPQVFGGASYTANDIYSPSRGIQHWGLSGQGYSNPTLQSLSTALLTGPASGVEPFFRDITIYGLSQKTFAQYTMINPMITEWTHDTYDYSQGNQVVTHTMGIRYENVKYYSGDIGGATPSGEVNNFADPSYYDTDKSPIAKSGSTNIPSQSIQDLQALSLGQNTLQNVVGAVGQGLVPTASAFLGSQLAGSGAYAQQIANQLAPAIGESIPSATSVPWSFPLGSWFGGSGGGANNGTSPVTASYNTNGTVDATDATAYGEG